MELLIWQMIMSTIAHTNNKIMWTNENIARGEILDGLNIHTVTPKTLSMFNPNVVHEAHRKHPWESRLAIWRSNNVQTLGYRSVP